MAYTPKIIRAGVLMSVVVVACVPSPARGDAFGIGSFLEGRYTAPEGDDPWGDAVDDFMAVPGTRMWVAAMGFPSADRAAVYVSRHGAEFQSAIRFLQETPDATMGELVFHQREQGYPTTPLQRFFHRKAPARSRARDARRQYRAEKSENGVE